MDIPNQLNAGPELSVIVIAYDMARELPRTLKTLSTGFQRGIDVDQYEIIVVDNGSSVPVGQAHCDFDTSNFTFIQHDAGDVSPVNAIHVGVNVARGRLVGVLIDGARMVTPGLFRNVLEAARSKDNPVIGTLAFHLGIDVQMRSVLKGYDQGVEDSLLASVPWESDGYRLFDISVFAGSSAKGWFEVPDETNALFMRRSFWDSLGGYDQRFRAPGGGLANLDIWKRAVSHPDAEVVMILGEGTFHQVHGGVATNAPPRKHWTEFDSEYRAIRGKNFRPPKIDHITYHGKLNVHCFRTLHESTFRFTEDEGFLSRCEARGTTVAGRPSESHMIGAFAERVLDGVMCGRYRGVPFCKSPFDIGLYMLLFSRITPRSVIEIGGKYGGSALWFADMLSAANDGDGRIVSIDNNPLHEFEDDRITFLKGDASALGKTLFRKDLVELPRPLVVIEDSSHTYDDSLATLNFFHEYLQPGDYIIVEDGIVSQLPNPKFRDYEDGPIRAIRDFLVLHGERYEIDKSLCDHYGYNATFNPNGYLRRL